MQEEIKRNRVIKRKKDSQRQRERNGEITKIERQEERKREIERG